MRNAPVILGREGKDAADAASAQQRTADERSERLRFSLPLLVLAGASLALSYALFHEALAPHSSRVPLWVLAFSVGVIATAGGSTSLLVGDFSGESWLKEARASPGYVVVRRGEWAALQEKLRLAGAETSGPTAPLATAPFELPEWEEAPALRAPSALPAPAADMSPPAPMAISHGIDSLATEVERLVADLESAAKVPASSTSPANVPATVPKSAPSASSNAQPGPATAEGANSPASSPPPAPATAERNPARSVPATRPASRSAPRSPSGPKPPVPSLPREEAEAEYRTLLAELEERAARSEVLPKRELVATAPAPAAPSDARCVGCDARLGPNDPSVPCDSCRSPMCASCRDRSAKEGYRGLCAVCSILAESEAQGRNRGR